MKYSYVAAAMLLHAGAALGDGKALSNALSACDTVSKKISVNSHVYYPGDLLNYVPALEHWMSSSSQGSACVVEVGSTEDTAEVMKVIASTRTPFAVKSGGHASNLGFSSTKGIQISLKRLNQIKLSNDKSQVTVGLGNVWTDVYSALDGTGRGVNGGRVSGPGTGGFTLGGGYSWTTNQYGLTCDSVASHTLVLPNGTIQTTKPGSDLSFALRGGLNRFGVVTDITYNTYKQGDVYGGLKIFAAKDVPALIRATNKFGGMSTDPRAQVILTLNTGPASPADAILLSLFNGPEADGIKAFAPFDNIKPIISTVKEQSFKSFGSSTPSQVQAGRRGAFHTMMTTKLTTAFMHAVYNESLYYGGLDGPLVDPGAFYSYDLEPFDLSYGQHSSDSAFPHSKSPLPLNLYFAWTLPENDKSFRAEMVKSVNRLIKVAKSEGIFDESQPVYPNYALARYSGEQLYGKNTQRLRAIRESVDPMNTMLLAGGFSI